MNANIKSKLNLHSLNSRKTLTLVSLLFMIAIISSPLVSTYSKVSPFALGAPDATAKDAAELVAAIADATDKTTFVIALTKDNIVLETTLTIPADKYITLTSEGSTNYKLIGPADKNTIQVKKDAQLVLDGIIVTHAADTKGAGVEVDSGGKLTLSSGQIFNNTVAGNGGGVFNYGSFTLSGGEILNNTATSGGGVYNYGSFTVSGGVISGNKVTSEGGGVSTYGTGASFQMTGGAISTKTANYGGGIYNDNSEITISGGEISKNVATTHGGGIYSDGNTTLSSNGLIFNNKATTYGGGVYNYNGQFKMSGGIVSNNTAVDGGGMYIYFGNFTMTNGRIANNTATRNGGGIGVPSLGGLERVEISSNAIFSNNVAATAYERSTDHDGLYDTYIGRSVTWTGSFKQGYNNYDILYIWGTETDDPEGPKPSTSPSPSSTSGTSSTPRPSNSGTPRPTPTSGIGDWFDWRIIVILALIIGLVVAVLVFYLPRRGAKQIEEDLSDFTVV